MLPRGGISFTKARAVSFHPTSAVSFYPTRPVPFNSSYPSETVMYLGRAEGVVPVHVTQHEVHRALVTLAAAAVVDAPRGLDEVSSELGCFDHEKASVDPLTSCRDSVETTYEIRTLRSASNILFPVRFAMRGTFEFGSFDRNILFRFEPYT